MLQYFIKFFKIGPCYANRDFCADTDNASTTAKSERSVRVIDGRTYDINSNPILEANRLEMQHSYMKMIWGGNFSLPIEDMLEEGIRVLDIGCGTGRWCCELAQKYPKSDFIGFDNVPTIFPTTTNFSNVTFLLHDARQRFPFEDASFDFISLRMVALCLTARQWEHVFREISRCLKVGGLVEWFDSPLTVQEPAQNTKRLQDALNASIYSRRINPLIHSEIPKIIEGAGKLKTIECLERQVPIGKHGGFYGQLALQDVMDMYSNLKKSILEFMSVTTEEYDDILEMFREEMEEHQSYFTTYRFHAQRVHET